MSRESKQDDPWERRALYGCAAALGGNVPQAIRDFAGHLDQAADVLADAPWIEGNAMSGHIFERYGGGGARSRLGVGRRLALSEIPEWIVRMSDDAAQCRMAELGADHEALGQTVATDIFYGSPQADPCSCIGLSAFCESPQGNVVDGGGDGGSSIWLLSWHQEELYIAYPKGSMAGLMRHDLGLQEGERDATGAREVVYTEASEVSLAIIPQRAQSVVRIANLAGVVGARLDQLMRAALGMLGDTKGRPTFYMNRTVAAARGSTEPLDDYPVRIADELRFDEARVA